MRARFTLLSLLAVLASYAAFSLRYYSSQEHLFDPFTQMPLTRLPASAPAGETDRIRILALGGSTTECRSLPKSLRYPTTVGQLLADEYPGRRFEVVNAGRDWFASRHSLISYVSYYQEWRPDLVLILEGINDLYRSFSPPAYARGDFDPLYSHFYGAAADAAMPPSFEQHLYRRWAGPLVIGQWYEAPFLRGREIDYPVSRYRSLGSFEENLVKLVGAVRASGATPILITQASLFKPDLSEEERRKLWFGNYFCNARTGFARYDYPSPGSMGRALAAFNEATRAVAARERVAIVDGDGAVPKTLEMFEDDCHYTVEGARRLAVAVTHGIKRDGLIGEAAATGSR